MTNQQIIIMEKSLRGIEEECHTYAKWKQLGYKVKSGEKALFCTGLWKVSNSKKEAESDSPDEKSSQRMYLAKSFLFSRSQVDKVVTEC